MMVCNTTPTGLPAGYNSVRVIVHKSFSRVLRKNQVLVEVGTCLSYDKLMMYHSGAIWPVISYDAQYTCTSTIVDGQSTGCFKIQLWFKNVSEK